MLPFIYGCTIVTCRAFSSVQCSYNSTNYRAAFLHKNVHHLALSDTHFIISSLLLAENKNTGSITKLIRLWLFTVHRYR